MNFLTVTCSRTRSTFIVFFFAFRIRVQLQERSPHGIRPAPRVLSAFQGMFRSWEPLHTSPRSTALSLKTDFPANSSLRTLAATSSSLRTLAATFPLETVTFLSVLRWLRRPLPAHSCAQRDPLYHFRLTRFCRWLTALRRHFYATLVNKSTTRASHFHVVPGHVDALRELTSSGCTRGLLPECSTVAGCRTLASSGGTREVEIRRDFQLFFARNKDGDRLLDPPSLLPHAHFSQDGGHPAGPPPLFSLAFTIRSGPARMDQMLRLLATFLRSSGL